MQVCLDGVMQNIPTILQYSGRYMMRTGNYQQCISTQGMDYNAVYLSAQGSSIASLYLSLCLPKVCQTQIVKQGVNQILNQMGFGYQVQTIYNKMNQRIQPFTWVFYLTVSIIAAFVILCVLSTFIEKFHKHKILGSFAFEKSLKIFKYTNKRNGLNLFNGIRSLAMLWVLFGHQYSLIIVNTSNILTINQMLAQWIQLFIQAGILAVDVFFFVGGFLVAYALLKQQHSKANQYLKYLLAIFNRYLRLVPSYLLAMLIYYSFSLHLVDGPYWFQSLQSVQKCQNMWRGLLFLDNIIDKGNNMCMGWAWYLQNDMQIFIYSVFILFIYSKSKFWAFITTFVTIGFSLWYTMEVVYENQYKYTTHLTDFEKFGDYMSQIYIKPWSRCPPYLFGLVFGAVYVQFLKSQKTQHIKQNNQKNISLIKQDVQHQEQHIFKKIKYFFQSHSWYRRIFQLSGMLIMAFIILIPRTAQGENHYWSQLAHSFFLTYSKLIFIIGLAILILPSLLSIDTLVMFALDTKAFNFMAKISFCTYLIHLTIIYAWIGSIKIDFYYSYVPLFAIGAAMAILSMTLGFILSVLVQVPLSKLQKHSMSALIKKAEKE